MFKDIIPHAILQTDRWLCVLSFCKNQIKIIGMHCMKKIVYTFLITAHTIACGMGPKKTSYNLDEANQTNQWTSKQFLYEISKYHPEFRARFRTFKHSEVIK